jgi:hypothetical protein
MSNKIKAIILFQVFISPILLKSVHFLFSHHEHHHFEYFQKHDASEYKLHHDKCPYLSYSLFEYYEKTTQSGLTNVKISFIILTDVIQSFFFIRHIISYSLRAPPYNVCISN